MRIIMTGGGTGGHIYPAIAIADEIKERNPGAEILFVGTEKGLEKTIVPENGYPIKFVKASGLNRKKILKNFKVLMESMSGISQAKSIIREFKPDVVIGTGGYVCGPVALAAKRMGIRVFIQEQNASPGLTNKLLAKHAEKIFLGFEEAGQHFKEKEKLVFSGNPVRKSFYGADREKARALLGIDENSFVILSFGGSQGAEKINEVMIEVSSVISGMEGFSVLFVTGRKHHENILKQFEKTELSKNIRIIPYMEQSDIYISACDVVISRAGALTVTEIAVCGRPAIFIPSVNVTGNHQHYNAKAMTDKGDYQLIPEKDLNADALINAAIRVKNNGAASLPPAGKRAAEIICENIGL